MKKSNGCFIIGLAIGIAIGTVMHNIAIGTAVGAALGVAFSEIGKRRECSDPPSPPQDPACL